MSPILNLVRTGYHARLPVRWHCRHDVRQPSRPAHVGQSAWSTSCSRMLEWGASAREGLAHRLAVTRREKAFTMAPRSFLLEKIMPPHMRHAFRVPTDPDDARPPAPWQVITTVLPVRRSGTRVINQSLLLVLWLPGSLFESNCCCCRPNLCLDGIPWAP